MFGLELVHVPYKGTAPALQDVAAGHIAFMFADVPPARGLIEGGKVRALGVTTAQRVKAMPDVPPLAEGGIPGYDNASWHTITTTGGVPKDIVEKLAARNPRDHGEAEVQETPQQRRHAAAGFAVAGRDEEIRRVRDRALGRGDHESRASREVSREAAASSRPRF